MNEAAASLSIESLFFHADIVVKAVLLLLFAASMWSWAVIIDRLWQLGAERRRARLGDARRGGAGRAGPGQYQRRAARAHRAGDAARPDRRIAAA